MRYVALTVLGGFLLVAGCATDAGLPPGADSEANAASGSVADTPESLQSELTTTVHWPVRDGSARSIPLACSSVKVRVTDTVTGWDLGTSPLVLVRPTSGSFVTTGTITDLPPKQVKLIATAHPDTAGEGTPVQASGEVTIELSPGSNTQGLSLALAITSVEATPSSAGIQVCGDTVLTATPRDADGNTVLTGNTWQWSSDNQAVATVASTTSSSCTVTGVTAGTATVTVAETTFGVSDTVAVTVTRSVTLVGSTPASDVILVGDTTDLDPIAEDNCDTAITSGLTFAWQSSDASIATVNATTGVVTGVSRGTATITVTETGSAVSGQATVEVRVPPVIGAVTATPDRVAPSESSQLSVTATDADGDALTYAWSVSPNEGDFAGTGSVVTWTAPATPSADSYTVTVTATDPMGGQDAETVTVYMLGGFDVTIN